MRINTLAYANSQSQGAARREWLRLHSPQHLEQCRSLILDGLQSRDAAASRSTLVLGAGSCTEVPLAELARASDEVVLADLDRAAMLQTGRELASPALRRRVQVLACDISGDVSVKLARLLNRQDWQPRVAQGATAVFDAAAQCIEQCPVPASPEIGSLTSSEFGLVISSLVLSQLFSYPLLDVLDHIQKIVPTFLGEQERHRRYQDAVQDFRVRIIKAHLHLLRDLLDAGGTAVLLSDIRGFVFNVYGTDHDASHRRTMPLVPRIFPDLVREVFTIDKEAQWEWITDLPEKDRLGRGYEVSGYVLKVP
jgi:cytochrome c5